jgi:hypothetical protein
VIDATQISSQVITAASIKAGSIPLAKLPVSEAWRDSAHYKAYVRPTLKEEE